MSKTKTGFQPKTEGQKRYLQTIKDNRITMCVGPAGTGKTLVATRYAASELIAASYQRIVIMRPMVQAGENTGFLPGDINEKMDPYVRPIFDELKPYFNCEQIRNYVAQQVIEVVPFAYARGRSFHNSFILVDEAQNASYSQLVLALTRFGHNSKMVITGDTDQSDLPKNEQGALMDIAYRTRHIEGVGFVELTNADILREPIIGNILSSLKNGP